MKIFGFFISSLMVIQGNVVPCVILLNMSMSERELRAEWVRFKIWARIKRGLSAFANLDKRRASWVRFGCGIGEHRDAECARIGCGSGAD